MNYPIYNKEMLAIVQAFEHWQAELEGTDHPVEVLTDYKALEYFINTKALSGQQACWAEVLFYYNFKILYQPGCTNKADPLTQMDTDTADLNCTKASAYQQQLLETDCLDLKIVRELGQYQQSIEISTIEQQLDFVNSILQLNCTSSEFNTARISADCKKGY
jgi:hypothetical protein